MMTITSSQLHDLCWAA